MYKVRPQLRFFINSADASRFRLSVATYSRRAKCEIYASVGYCRASTLAQAYLPSSFLTYNMILWTIKNLDGWKPCKPSKFDSIAVWHGQEWYWRAACIRKIVAGRKTCRNTKTPVSTESTISDVYNDALITYAITGPAPIKIKHFQISRRWPTRLVEFMYVF